jgi:hypothetical protein
VLSFFKRKPKYNNEAGEDLSLMLTNYPEDPVLNESFFSDLNMDFSIESLIHVDSYLESLRDDLPEDDELIKITMRCGSYVGEVIRKNSSDSYNWVEHKQAEKINEQIKSWGFGLATASVLWSEPDKFIFPLAKILKRLENGSEDSVHFFAQVASSGEMYN